MGEMIKIMSTHKKKVGILTCLAAIVWTIWMIMDALIFNKQHTEDGMIAKIIKIRAWQWSISNGSITHRWEILYGFTVPLKLTRSIGLKG